MTFVETIVHQIPALSKPHRDFLVALFAALSCFVGRATMLNLSRFGAGSPRRIDRWLRRPFDWKALNWTALEHEGVTNHGLLACFDCSFLPKSGKHTWGKATFYNGCASRPEPGCELASLGLLDPVEHTAYALESWLTPASFPKPEDPDQPTPTRTDFYAQRIRLVASWLLSRGVGHIVCDGGFANLKFLTELDKTDLELISTLRRDSDMRFLYTGPRKTGPGRPKLYDGKVDWRDLSRFERMECEDEDVELWWADLNSPRFKRTLRVVVCLRGKGSRRRRKLLFTTDLTLEALEVYRWYGLRFQHEFVFRDGKQHTGLADGQMRDKTKRGEFVNASLSALNLMRLEERRGNPAGTPRVISMSTWKRRRHAQHVADRIFGALGLDAQTLKNLPAYHALRRDGFIAS